MQPVEAPDDVKRGDEENVFVGRRETPDNRKSLTRPAVEMLGTLETAASLLTAADRRRAKGACCT